MTDSELPGTVLTVLGSLEIAKDSLDIGGGHGGQQALLSCLF